MMAIFNTILWLGVTFKSPLVLSMAGLTPLGPLAGGMFATAQGAAIGAGTYMAAGQAIAMAPMIAGTWIWPVLWTGTMSSVVITASIFSGCCSWFRKK